MPKSLETRVERLEQQQQAPAYAPSVFIVTFSQDTNGAVRADSDPRRCLHRESGQEEARRTDEQPAAFVKRCRKRWPRSTLVFSAVSLQPMRIRHYTPPAAEQWSLSPE